MASNEETIRDVFETLNEKQKTVVYALIGQALEDAKMANNEETIRDVFETLNEKQKTVVYALIGQALEDAKNYEYDN